MEEQFNNKPYEENQTFDLRSAIDALSFDVVTIEDVRDRQPTLADEDAKYVVKMCRVVAECIQKVCEEFPDPNDAKLALATLSARYQQLDARVVEDRNNAIVRQHQDILRLNKLL